MGHPMGLERFSRFQELRRQGHDSRRMGFRVKTGEINIFSNRMRLARAFNGIILDGYSDSTVAGYNAFIQVVLTHSALECFMGVQGLKNKNPKNGKESPQWDKLTDLMAPHEPGHVIALFNSKDKDGKFFDFLHSHLDSELLKTNLTGCRDGSLPNVSYISASVRHMFAHGHLTANANGINPQAVSTICQSTPDFLIRFMDCEFSKVIDTYCAKIDDAA